GQRQAALLGDVGKEVQTRVDVLFIAAVGNGRSQYAVDGLGGGADVTDGDLVAAFFQVSPGFWGLLDQFLVDDESDGAGGGDHPVAVVVLGPVRDLIPGGGFVRLSDALLHGDGPKGGADVADVGGGVGFLGGELGDFLRRAHVGVAVLEAIQALQIGPGVLP